MNDPRKAEFLREVDQLADQQAEIMDDGFVFRLLPGEEPSSDAPEDADHWCAVFDELIRFTQDLLARVERDRDAGQAPPEVEQEQEALALELQRLRAHHRFWSQRAGGPSRLAG